MSSDLSPEDLQRLDTLFERAADLPPGEHESFLARECGSNDALRQELARLLEGLAGEDVLGRFLPGTPLPAGTRIGPYILQERIGQGGMGEVYAAEQHEPIRRRVALKIIRPGMDSAQVVARFHAERQALARMAHPHVAQVFDAGATDDGRPYFVMEYVAGEAITEYCDRRKLSTRARLELFLDVCEGVQHAHQKGIIHRDLKPSNLLVTEQQGRAFVKVIDFGVARATTGRLAERTLHTVVGQIVGTLDYMSPEQADPTGRDIDTRSDIYSLGVVLYQLASGLLPFEHASSVDTPFSEIVRTIRETDPPTPSTRLRRSTGTASGIASLRGTDERVLARQLHGDLDWICLKALEKDPVRRYASASELAEDLRRHLAHEPVLAGRPGALYRARKFVRRNRAVASATLGILAALVAGLLLSLRFGMSEAAQRLLAELSSYRANLRVTLESLEEGNYAAAREAHERAPERLRNWEWHLLDQRWVQELTRVTIPAVARATFLDEDRVLAADGAGGVHVWNVLSGALATIRSPGASGSSAADGWPAETTPLVLSPDGKWLLASAGEELFLGDPLGPGPPVAIPVPGEAPLADPGLSALAPDGSRGAVATRSGRVVLFSADGILGTIPWDAAPPLSLVLHPLEPLLAIRRDGKLCLWSTEPLEKLWEEKATYGAVAFAPDGSTLVAELQTDAGSGTGLFFKDPRTGTHVRTLSRQKYGAYHLRRSGELAFSADRRLLALTFSHAGIFLLDAEAGRTRTTAGPEAALRKTGSGAVGFAEYDPGGDVLVAFSPSGTTLLSLGVIDQSLRLWRTGIDGVSRVCRGHASPVRAVAFSPDGATIASGADDGSLRLWDTASDDPVATLPNDGASGALAFSADGRQLACMVGDGLVVRDLTLGTAVVLPGEYTGAMAFDPDGSLLAAARGDGGVRIWNAATFHAATFHESRELACAEGAVVSALVFAGDGKLLVTGSSLAELDLWELATGARLEGWKSGHAGNTSFRGALSMALAPDGKRLAVGWGDSSVSILELPSLAVVREMGEHRGEVFAVAYSPDGTRLASGGGDGYLRLWDAASGDPLLGLEEHGDAIRALAFSPDGRRIATGSRDTTVRIWDSDTAIEQWSARGARAAVELDAESLVARLFTELSTPEAVSARLAEDPALGPDLRRAALRSVLRRELDASSR